MKNARDDFARDERDQEAGRCHINPASSNARSTAGRLAADGQVMGRRTSPGMSGRTRLSAYLAGPGEQSLNMASCNGYNRSCSSSARVQTPVAQADWKSATRPGATLAVT